MNHHEFAQGAHTIKRLALPEDVQKNYKMFFCECGSDTFMIAQNPGKANRTFCDVCRKEITHGK